MANYNNWALGWYVGDVNRVPGWLSSDISIGSIASTPNLP